jgi:nucleoside diphosphate kinase
MSNYFNPKEENLSYTLAIIKPETALKEENVKTIIDLLENKGFIIHNMLHKDLTQQECQNIFYKHLKQPYYSKIEQYMLSSPCIIILLCH